MHRILAIARLTWKSAFRYRLFWIMAALLVAAVVGLPLILKDDGTAAGLTQILLTYTLSAITVLLGFATLWLSCGTLARDVEDCQIQMICTKPIARWQVWVGKLLGILALNAMLLAISGGAVFTLLKWRAQRLPAEQQAKIQSEIFIARAPAKERPPDVLGESQVIMDQWLKTWHKDHPNEGDPSMEDSKEAVTRIVAGVKSKYEEIDPGFSKAWKINLSSLSPEVRAKPLQLRVKFHVADAMASSGATYDLLWRIGAIDSPNAQIIKESLPADSYQEISIPSLVDPDGTITVQCGNAQENNTAVFFPVEDGFELLYRENSFGVNFIRGLAVILCWLVLLSALGLASASFLSFPVAAFVSLAVLLVGLSTGTLSSVQEQKSIFSQTGGEKPTLIENFIDSVAVPAFGAVLKVVNLVQSFSPVDDLSTGHSITWSQLGRAVGQIVFLMGGIFGVAGVVLFYRRELAAVQANA